MAHYSSIPPFASTLQRRGVRLGQRLGAAHDALPPDARSVTS